MIFYEPVFKIMSPQGDWCEMPVENFGLEMEKVCRYCLGKGFITYGHETVAGMREMKCPVCRGGK